MLWITLALSLSFVAASLVLAILWRRRARRVRIAFHGAASVGQADTASGVYGLGTADLAALRQAPRSSRTQWSRDYAMEAAAGMPGRVGGIPRGLRVRS